MRRDEGLTLAELTISIAIISIIALSAAALFDTSLDIYEYATGRGKPYHEAHRIMEMLRREVHTSGHLILPHGGERNTTALVLTAGINQDNDFYSGNPRFPRLDEDASADMNNDGASGIPILSDLLGGLLGGLGGLLTNRNDDDGDGSIDEDPYDGIDNDGDGAIDEDWGDDINSDGYSGLRGVDENLDGLVDNTSSGNDDEDGAQNEDWIEALMYRYDVNTRRILRNLEGNANAVVMAENVEGFNVTYEGGTSAVRPRLLVRLVLPDGRGGQLTFQEYIVPRNLLQLDGRRLP